MNHHPIIEYAPGASLDPTRHAHWADGSSLLRAKEIPWTPWALPKTFFKLLDFNRNFAYFVFLLRVDSDSPAVIHKHIGAANAYILEGGFSYEHGALFEGDFMCEAGGITHTPQIHETGCTMFAFGHGTLAGLNPDGSVAGLIDTDWMVERAKEYNAFAHLAWKDAA